MDLGSATASDPRGARRSRRAFASGALLGAFGTCAAAAGTGALARWVNPYRPGLERITLPLPSAHAYLAGTTIGFLADPHYGPFMSESDIRLATSLLAAESPDLVLLGGDYISESPRYASGVAAILGELAKAAPLGALAVLGNHDVAETARAKRVISTLEASGIRVLRDEAAVVETDRGALWIAGIDDAILGRPNPIRAFADVPTGAAALALWHEPDYAEQTAALGAFAQLSGHSHGGQVRLPGVGAVFLPPGGRRYPMGFAEVGAMHVYTSRGVGVYVPPVRFNCPPEVTLVTLATDDGRTGSM